MRSELPMALRQLVEVHACRIALQNKTDREKNNSVVLMGVREQCETWLGIRFVVE